MLRKVKFYGKLKEFGDEFEIEASSPGEAIRLIAMQVPGLEKFIRAGYFKVRVGQKSKGLVITAETIHWLDNTDQTIHVEPAIVGSKKQGMWMMIAGILIVAVAVGAAFFTGGASLAALPAAMGTTTALGVSMTTVALFGATLAISGLATMLTPVPKLDSPLGERADEKQSFLFDGAVNSSAQGNALPLVYGVFGVGSLVVSTGISVENL